MSEELKQPEMLPRKRLNNRLKHAMGLPLCIVCAPLGYGKTSVVRDFLPTQKEYTTVWYTMSTYEEDPSWLWQKIITQMTDCEVLDAEKIANYSFPSSNRERQSVIYALTHDIEQPTCLVLDDCHQCRNSLWHQWIESLTYARIPNLHIIYIGRSYPDIPYEEFELKALCAVIDQKMLRLSLSEIAEFFKINHQSLEDTQIEEIYSYTEGWMAAVYLSLLDYQRSGCVDNHDRITNLVRTSVYNKFNAEQKQILAIMSAFHQFTEEQATAITKNENCPEALHTIVQSTHFVKFDFTTRTYVVHSLLRAVAAENLFDLQIQEDEIARRGGTWYESRGKYIEACINFLRAKDCEAIFRILEKTDALSQYEQAPDTFIHFFQEVSFPNKTAHLQVYLLYLYYRLLYIPGQETDMLCHEIIAYYEQSQNESAFAALYLVRMVLAVGDITEMVNIVKQSWEILHTESSISYPCMEILCQPEAYTLFYRQRGQLFETFKSLNIFTSYYILLNHGSESGWKWLYLAQYALVTGNIEQSLQQADIALTKARFQSCEEVILQSTFCKARALLFLGRKAELQKLLQEMAQDVKGFTHKMAQDAMIASIAYIDTMLGNKSDLLKETGYPKYSLGRSNIFLKIIKIGSIAWGAALAKRKQFAQLEALAENMQENNPCLHVRIIAKIYGAIAIWNLNEHEEGKKRLWEAVELACADDNVIWFVENMQHITPILEAMQKNDAFLQKIKKLGKQYLEGLQKCQDASIQDIKKDRPKLLLTEREEQIMQLVAQGLRNSEISKKLFIALVTVEKNLTNVYRKLGVSNRTAAIIQYQKLQE